MANHVVKPNFGYAFAPPPRSFTDCRRERLVATFKLEFGIRPRPRIPMLIRSILSAAISSVFVGMAGASRLEQAGAIALPNVNGGFDLMAADAAGDRFFLAAEDNGSLEIVDLKAAKRIKSIGGMEEPKWIVFRPETRRLFVSNGDGKVRTFNSDNYEAGRVLELREKANNLRFDANTKELFVGIGKTFGAISVVDTRSDRVTAEIPLAAFPKQFEIEGDRIYVNVPTANHVAVISRAAKKVVATWPVRAATDNVPMGFDRAAHRLFVGCEPGKLVVFETPTGREVDAIDIDPEADGIYYDRKRRLIYISCGAGFIDVVRQKDTDHYERVERIPTVKGAGTSLFVPELDRYFLAVPAHDNVQAELRIYRPNAPTN